ncbi:MAG: hypothetical protein ACQEQ4_04315 [Fibrobacterota bacterium]
MYNSWISAENNVFENRLDSIRTARPDGSIRSRIIRDPGNQNSIFPLSLGYYRSIDEKTSAVFFLAYGFSQKKLGFEVRDYLDTSFSYSYENTLRRHRADISARLFRAFDETYFSIDGFEQAGLAYSAGLIPLDVLVEADEVFHGYGASWGISFFGRRFGKLGFLQTIGLGYQGCYIHDFRGEVENIAPGAETKFVSHNVVFSVGFVFIQPEGVDE